MNHSNESLKRRAQGLFAADAPGPRREALEKYRPALRLTADRSRGQQVFVRECATCHRLEGQGFDVGPNLETIRNRSADELLTNILDPNREVSPNYLEYIVALTDGRVLTGIVANETATSLDLRRAQGVQETVLRTDIDQIAASGKALMAEGLDQKLTPQDVVDLIAWLLVRQRLSHPHHDREEEPDHQARMPRGHQPPDEKRPDEGLGEEKTYQVFKKNILRYSKGSANPRFWGVVAGTGSPFGMLTSMLTAGINTLGEATPSVSGYVHNQVINWIKEMLDYPKEAGGVLVSGGSEANFTALAVARNARAEVDVKTNGVQNLPHTMTVYVSDGGHQCLERSVELLGIGGSNLRWIPSDGDCRIKIDELKNAIKSDRDAGRYPFCLVGNAGTVDAGAFDDLNALADLAAKEKMWFHVDAAFGGWVKISSGSGGRRRGS